MNIPYLSESHLIYSAAWSMDCYEQGYQDGLSRQRDLADVKRRIVFAVLSVLLGIAAAVIWHLWQRLGALA